VLPASADEWGDDRRRAVLLHELAHVARRDCLVQRIAACACAFYWPHPGVWWAARRLRTERELACDDRVLASGAAARDYAGHLLDIAHAFRARRRRNGRRHGARATARTPAAGDSSTTRAIARRSAAVRGRRARRGGGRVFLPMAVCARRSCRSTPRRRLVAASSRAGVHRHVGTCTPRAIRAQCSSPFARGARRMAARSRSPMWSGWRGRRSLARPRCTFPSARGGHVHHRRHVPQQRVRRHVSSSSPAPRSARSWPSAASAADAEDQFYLAVSDVGLAYLDTLAAAGYAKPDFARSSARRSTASTPLRQGHGGLGYRSVRVDALIRLRDHGVDPEYVAGMASSGLAKLSADDLVRARDHGVDPATCAASTRSVSAGSASTPSSSARDHGSTRIHPRHAEPWPTSSRSTVSRAHARSRRRSRVRRRDGATRLQRDPADS
jgi:hypothetical protein